jgi:hypothetical protein
VTHEAAGKDDKVGCVADGHDVRRLERFRVDPDKAVRQHLGRPRGTAAGELGPDQCNHRRQEWMCGGMGQRDTTMQYGVEEEAKSGFARADALLQRLPLDA